MKRKNLIAVVVFIGILIVIDLPRLMSSTCPHFPPPGACGDPTTNPLAPCNPSGSPSGPGSCTCSYSGCHPPVSGNPSAVTIMIVDSAVYNITSTFDTLTPAFRDTPGHTYLMAFLLSSNTGIYGFEMTALNLTPPDTLLSTMAGSFVVTDPTHTFLQTTDSGIQYITHHNASSFLNWEYKWIAPANSKPVTFYYSYNLSDSAFLDSVVGTGTGYPGGTIAIGRLTIESAITGINDISDKIANLEIFPNPVSDQFNVSFNLKQSEAISLNVYSVDGKMVQQLMQNEKRDEGYFNSSFDISSLAAGVYLVKLNVDGASITKKITKL